MKRIFLFCMAAMLVMGVSSFSVPVKKQFTVKIKNLKVDETFEVTAGPGLGAHEVVIYVDRVGADAGLYTVEFDVDIMYDYIPAHTQTHHVYISGGNTHWQEARYANWIVGTDATPVGDVYNVVY